ncbi:putative quinol monooxygenase [Haliangium sp.]|uniref:putative quinol monooxygenase n=1 Tax=Haliangium sp. TaxID=2663208 RepID=UPI003D0E9C20
MIAIAGQLRLDPANHESAVTAIQAMMDATRKEAGCISYTVSADLGAPGVFYIFEEWDSDEAVAAHIKTPHMAALQQALGGLGVQELRLQRYEVSAVSPLTL